VNPIVPAVDPRLARKLILDELFDLSLYQRLQRTVGGDLRRALEELIPIETRHFAFWQEFFGIKVSTLDRGRRLKLALIDLTCRVLGEPAVLLVLEAVEVYGVRKYLSLWTAYKDGPLGGAVKEILEDEFRHEDMVVSEAGGRKINPGRIRDIFLGLNDGLVEIVGAVSGFFAAFTSITAVVAAGLTTAVAGALSMAAGAYVASSSETEIRRTEMGKRQFLGEATHAEQPDERPSMPAFFVGVSYFVGTLVPLGPVALGATSLFFPLLTAGVVLVIVSLIVAFLSGMDIKRRIVTNLVTMAVAVAVTYTIGVLAKTVWGISI